QKDLKQKTDDLSKKKENIKETTAQIKSKVKQSALSATQATTGTADKQSKKKTAVIGEQDGIDDEQQKEEERIRLQAEEQQSLLDQIAADKEAEEDQNAEEDDQFPRLKIRGKIKGVRNINQSKQSMNKPTLRIKQRTYIPDIIITLSLPKVSNEEQIAQKKLELVIQIADLANLNQQQQVTGSTQGSVNGEQQRIFDPIQVFSPTITFTADEN
ncbi:MAG: hypothetical protein EZS28_050462, partial [Streblomastix strix]